MRSTVSKFVSPRRARDESGKRKKEGPDIITSRVPRGHRKTKQALNDFENIKDKPNDGLAAFTHFLLGKTEMDPLERQEMIRQQENQKLYQLLNQQDNLRMDREQNRKMIMKIQKRLSKQNLHQGVTGFSKQNEAQIVKKKNSLEGLVPEMTDSDENEPSEVSSSSEEDPDAKENYKNSYYWSLPENVRQAIDTAKKDSKHSDFYGRLRSLNDKIGVYKTLFYTKAPAFERQFYERKRQKLEELMRKEQNELEFFLLKHGSAEKSINGKYKSNLNLNQPSSPEKPSTNVVTKNNMAPNNNIVIKQEYLSNQNEDIKNIQGSNTSRRESLNNEASKAEVKYHSMAPAGKTRQILKLNRQYESSIEIQDGTKMRSLKLGLSQGSRLYPSQKSQMNKHIRQLKNSDSANLTDKKQPLLPRKFGSINSYSHQSLDQVAQQQNINEFNNKRQSDGEEESFDNNQRQNNSLQENEQQHGTMKIPITKLQEINESQSDSIDDEPDIVNDQTQSKEDFSQHQGSKNLDQTQINQAQSSQRNKNIAFTKLEMSPSSPNFQQPKNLQGINQSNLIDSVSEGPMKDSPDVKHEVNLLPQHKTQGIDRNKMKHFQTNQSSLSKRHSNQKRSSIRDQSTDNEDNQKITDMLKHIDNSINELNKENPEGRKVLNRLNYNPNMRFSKNRLMLAQKELNLMKINKKKNKKKLKQQSQLSKMQSISHLSDANLQFMNKSQLSQTSKNNLRNPQGSKMYLQEIAVMQQIDANYQGQASKRSIEYYDQFLKPQPSNFKLKFEEIQKSHLQTSPSTLENPTSSKIVPVKIQNPNPVDIGGLNPVPVDLQMLNNVSKRKTRTSIKQLNSHHVSTRSNVNIHALKSYQKQANIKDSQILLDYGSALQMASTTKKGQNPLKKKKIKKEMTQHSQASLSQFGSTERHQYNATATEIVNKNSNPYNQFNSQMDGSTGGNHGEAVTHRQPPVGHGPEVAYDESVNSSVYENNTQVNRSEAQQEMALPNMSQKFLQNFEDTDDSAEDRDDLLPKKKKALIKVDEQKRRRQHERKSSLSKGKVIKRGGKAKHHRWKTQFDDPRHSDQPSRADINAIKHAHAQYQSAMMESSNHGNVHQLAARTYMNASDYNLSNLHHIDNNLYTNRNNNGSSSRAAFIQQKKSHQGINLKSKRDGSHSKYGGKQFIDSYVSGMLHETKKRKSAHPTSMLDNLASRGNLPILSLQELDKMPQSTSNAKYKNIRQTKLPPVFKSPNQTHQAPGGTRHSGGRSFI